MGAKNSRNRHVVEVAEAERVVTSIATSGEDENYKFDDNEKRRLVSDLCMEFPYIYFSINLSTGDLEWGISKKTDYSALIRYTDYNRTLYLDDDLTEGVHNYIHILSKVRVMIIDTNEVKAFLLLEELKRQRELVDEKVKEYLEPIQEKIAAIYTLLDSLPGSQSYLEARSHFQRRRQSL